MVGRSPVAEAWILALSGTVATSMPGRRGPCSGSICGIAAAARSACAARPVPICCGPETRVAPTARAVFPPPDSLPSPARWLAAGGHNGTGADIRPKEEVRMKPRQAALGRAPQNGGSGAIGRLPPTVARRLQRLNGARPGRVRANPTRRGACRASGHTPIAHTDGPWGHGAARRNGYAPRAAGYAPRAAAVPGSFLADRRMSRWRGLGCRCVARNRLGAGLAAVAAGAREQGGNAQRQRAESDGAQGCGRKTDHGTS